MGYIIRNLNINFLVSFQSDKVDLFFIQDTHINFISASEQFHCNNVFNHSAIVQIFRPKFGVTERMVTQIILIVGCEILFALNVIPAELIEGKSIT